MTTPEFLISRFSKPTIEAALGAAGLRDIRWELPEVSLAGLKEYGEEYWREYLARPNWVLLECRKE